MNVNRSGTTSAASMPRTRDEVRRTGRRYPDAVAPFTAFGAGLTYGAALVRW
jgi:3-oxoacyl-[acyl-carrier-protein] synthase-3